MKINLVKNTVRGTFFGTVQKVITVLFPFVIRTIFIRTLGADYLGLNSLFTSTLQVLNLAELGVGSALVFSMYRPIVEDNTDQICRLMNLYRKYYRIIGVFILCAGLCLLPFLRFLIKGSVPADINLYIIYLMDLGASVLSYWLFSYRNCLFQAHQRVDIKYILGICVSLLTYSTQILALVVFHSYYLYLGVKILFQIFSNLSAALLSKRFYPHYRPKGKLPPEEVRVINGKVRDLMTAKLGSTINHSFDSIVVSSFLGLTVLAVYGNYYSIVSAISSALMIFFDSVQPGIGHFLLSHNDKQKRELLYQINFINFFALNVCSCCFMNLYQPFIQLVYGEKYLLEYPLVILFSVYFISNMFYRPCLVFKDAAGIWRADRFRPLVCSLVNLTLNLMSVQWIGLYGILLSTIVSLAFVGFPWLIINIDRNLFRIDIKGYLLRCFQYLAVIVLSSAGTVFLCKFFTSPEGVAALAERLVISVLVSSLVFIACFNKTKEYDIYFSRIKSFLLRRKAKPG